MTELKLPLKLFQKTVHQAKSPSTTATSESKYFKNEDASTTGKTVKDEAAVNEQETGQSQRNSQSNQLGGTSQLSQQSESSQLSQSVSSASTSQAAGNIPSCTG